MVANGVDSFHLSSRSMFLIALTPPSVASVLKSSGGTLSSLVRILRLRLSSLILTSETRWENFIYLFLFYACKLLTSKCFLGSSLVMVTSNLLLLSSSPSARARFVVFYWPSVLLACYYCFSYVSVYYTFVCLSVVIHQLLLLLFLHRLLHYVCVQQSVIKRENFQL